MNCLFTCVCDKLHSIFIHYQLFSLQLEFYTKRIILLLLLFLLTSLSVYAQRHKARSVTDKKFVPGRVLIKLKAKSTTYSGMQLRQSASTRNLMQKIGAVSHKTVFSEQYASPKQQRIAEEIGLNRWVVVTVPVVTDMDKLLTQLRQDSNVEIAEPEYIEKADAVPNDTLYLLQQHLPQIKAQEAWDIEKGDSTVIIAIIDTGVDWDHPDLASIIWNNPTPGDSNDVRGWDFVDITGLGITDGDPNDDLYTEDSNPMDFQGHGTHCAGIAAAATNNSTGVASISWGCKVMPLRIGFRTSDGGGGGLDILDGARISVCGR